MTGEEQTCWAVLPAAGIGSRMDAALPKQYLTINGKTLLEHSLGALLADQRLRAVVVALHPRDSRAASIPLLAGDRVLTVVGGEQRSDSVRAALAALETLADPGDWVLVHDAARPCLSAEDLGRLVTSVIGSGTGGILAEPIVDTVKQADEPGYIARTLDRSRLWRAQTPQMFRLGELREALDSADAEGFLITDEASAMERMGATVQLVPGSARNLKVTLPGDLPLARWYLDSGA